MIKIAVFDSKPYTVPAFMEEGKAHGVEYRFFDTRLSPDTASLAAGFDGVCAFVNDDLGQEVLEKLYALGIRLVALRCAGFNNVDLKYAYGKIHVLRVPAYSPAAVAEHAMALLLTSVRRIHKAYNRTREYNFSLNGLVGFNLKGKTVGVIGAGKIGRAFIEICRGFGMRVLFYDAFVEEVAGATRVSLDELFKESDVISLHCPLTEETYHLIGKDSFSKMKKGVIIVNTSRGALVDAEALISAIKEKQVGAALLDVYEEESDLFFEDVSGHILQDDVLSRLLSMPNVIVTSHQAFLTEEALLEIAKTTTENVVAFFDRQPLVNEVCYRCDNQKVKDCRKERKGKCF